MDIIVNGRSIPECSEEDLFALVDNQDYRENQYLDYKEDFSYFKANGKDAKEKEAYEFRKDVCSFANAEGGYLIYGICEKEGVATKIDGIEISNRDRFENDVRNLLSPIMPRQPQIMFYFIDIRAKPNHYVVILSVGHDYYAPYTYIEKEDNYKFTKRDGNHKTKIGYAELRNMFNQSQTLEEKILEFRKDRIAFRKENDGKGLFVLLHVFPESYLTKKESLFIWERSHHCNLGSVFSGSRIESFSIPCVDGLRYISTERNREGIIYDNGICEYYCSLTDPIEIEKDTAGTIIYEKAIWSNVEPVLHGYQKEISEIFGKQRYFGCLSIVGCKGFISEFDYRDRPKAWVDRNTIICNPVVFMDIKDGEIFHQDTCMLHFEFLLSLGIRDSEKMDELTRELKI